MRTKVLLHPKAAEEIEAIVRYDHQMSKASAQAFLAELTYAREMVVAFPEAWSPFEQGTRRFVLKNYPYALICNLDFESVEILGVMHMSRQPGYWKIQFQPPSSSRFWT